MKIELYKIRDFYMVSIQDKNSGTLGEITLFFDIENDALEYIKKYITQL